MKELEKQEISAGGIMANICHEHLLSAFWLIDSVGVSVMSSARIVNPGQPNVEIFEGIHDDTAFIGEKPAVSVQ